MWILEKPLLEDAISDIAKVIAESGGVLDNDDGAILASIYQRYDNNGGQMQQEWEDELEESKKNKLHDLFGITYENQKLYFIRKALMKMVDTCPMCGIQPPSQLDHQSPRSDFKTMSVSRLNLVPVCGVCNNKKRDKDPHGFVHPYYDHSIKDVPFFVITIHSNPRTHRMSWKFSINEAVISDKALADKINKQVGVVKLYRRLYRETNGMLSDLLSGIDDITEDILNFLLQKEYKTHLKRRGPNDWHTVFVKALNDSPIFTIEEAKVYAKTIKPINGGVNA